MRTCRAGALLLVLLLTDRVICQFEDDAIRDVNDNLVSMGDIEFNSDDEEEEVRMSSRASFGSDDKPKLVPTFVAPVERFMRTLIRPLAWIAQIGTNSRKNATRPTNQIISALTKPVQVAGKTIRGSFGQVLNLIGSRFKAIYPGTEWCGAGNISSSVDNVGLFKKTDSCCREHDLCSLNMSPGEAKNGLLNTGTFTRSYCGCDTEFYQCLKKVRSLVSRNLGYTYFNVLRPQCFKEDYPATCAKYGKNRLRYNKCVDYKYDTKKNKTWQWFDNPDF